jgi:cardiolipin synthase
MFTIPNLITLGRILLVPVFVIAFALPGEGARVVAFVVFCIAGASDALDGLAARRFNAGSDFGRMLDPIADKILVAIALMMLVAEGTIGQFVLTPGLQSLLRLVPALIILAREILVSGLREFLAELRVGLPVSQLAKWKTTVQMVAIAFLLVGDAASPMVTTLGIWLIWIAAGLTLITGYDYLRTGLRHMAEDAPPGSAE